MNTTKAEVAPEFQKWVELAEKLGREKFAPNARAIDE